MTRKIQMAAALTLVAGAAGAAMANPVSGIYFDVAPNCDSHGPHTAYDELGTGPAFPLNELVLTSAQVTQNSACPAHDSAALPNAQIRMLNLTGLSWTDLFYVGDPETSFSNVDGAAISNAAPGAIGHAFRIDNLGMNKNLVSESILADGIFQPNEIWEFIIQDYSNTLGLAPWDFSSLDFAGASSGAGGSSSGSIIAMKVVPAPGAIAMLGLGGLAMARRRRS